VAVAGGTVATVVGLGATAGGCRGTCDEAAGAPAVAGLEAVCSISGGRGPAVDDALADAGSGASVIVEGGPLAAELAGAAPACTDTGWADDERSFTTAKTPTLDPTSAAATIPKTAPRDDFGTEVDVTKGADVLAAVGMGVKA